MLRCFALSLAVFLSLFQPSEATVCRKHGLDGYDMAAARAKEYLPPPTKNISEMSLYIEKDPNGRFYFHSNYLSEDAIYPTKIGGESNLTNLDEALLNIVFTEYPSPSQQIVVRKAMLEDIRIYVNHDIFDENGRTLLDFKGRTNLIMVDPLSRTSTAGMIIETRNPPPFGAERIEGCCLSGRPPGKGIGELKLALRQSKLKKDNMKLVSLVGDTATNNTISGSSLKSIDIRRDHSKAFTSADLNTIFESNKGKDIVVLGHVEDGKFVTRSASGQVEAEIDIAALRSAAQKHDVFLIEMGCNTAGTTGSFRDAGVSISTRFNTVDASRRLAQALDKSESLIDFFNNIADNSLQVIVNSRRIEERTQYIAEYYDKTPMAKYMTKVGTIIVTTRSDSFLSSWLPSWMKR